MICYAVPTLKKNIKGVDEKVPNYGIPKNDLFPHDGSSTAQIKMLTVDYKRRLTAYLWLSTFSFFEAYVISAIQELIEFHGGTRAFIKYAGDRARRAVQTQHPADINRMRSRLSGIFKPTKFDKFTESTRKLEAHDYVFPSDLFAAYGVRILASRAKKLKAAEIPKMLSECLSFDLETEMARRYEKYRTIRNKIAHGEHGQHSLKAAFDVKYNLGKIAQKIDQHIVTHFFVSERFRR